MSNLQEIPQDVFPNQRGWKYVLFPYLELLNNSRLIQMKSLQDNIWSLASCVHGVDQERLEWTPSSWLCLFWIRYCLRGCSPFETGILRVWALEPAPWV